MDAALFLDMDMSILGVKEEDYHIYADQIRREYAHIAEPDYRKGRTRVLRGFLQHQYIYISPTFRTLFESQARSNIVQEIARLEG